jgi:hypothetical protein
LIKISAVFFYDNNLDFLFQQVKNFFEDFSEKIPHYSPVTQSFLPLIFSNIIRWNPDFNRIGIDRLGVDNKIVI